MLEVLCVLPGDDAQRAALRAFEEKYDVHVTFSTIPEATKEQVQAADIILGNVAPNLIAASKKLQWIQTNSAGADQYCKEGALDDATILTCATGAYGLSVSDWMLTVSLMLDRKMDLYGRNQTKNLWQVEGKVTSPYQSTTLVLGLGDIGEDYARKMKALGSYTIGVRRKPSEKPDWLDEIHTTDEIDELIPRADYVAMILPGTPATYHIMDERRMRLMKSTAYLINAGRGNAIDQDALNKILREGGVIAGAALDVTDPEPLPADSPLWDAPRCIITPHIAGQFHLAETVVRINKIACENLTKFLEGQAMNMRNIVDRKTGYRAR